jgi:outer membrane protein insertion porin family
MKATRRFGHSLIAVIFTLGILLSAGAPIYAADYTGKKITAVSVTGNATVPENQIMAVVKVKPGDTFDPEKIRQDMQSVYELGSFFDVVTNFSEVPEGVKVTYTVMENPALKEIIFKGKTKISTDKLKSMLTVKQGSVLNSKTLSDDSRAMEQYYHDQGYILARVSDVNMSPGGVLTLTVNEGILEGILIKGNEKTKTNVITREIKVKPGDPFNVKDAKRSMQKVYNTGYFEDVNMKLNPGREPNGVVLEADVVEQKTGTFTVGGGYSQADGLIGIIEVGDTNFKGTGDKVKVHYEFGGKDSAHNYILSYAKPWLDDKQTSIGASVFNTTYQYNDYGLADVGGNNSDVRSTYDRQSRGFSLSLGRPQGDYIQNNIVFKREKDSYAAWVSGTNYNPGSIQDDYNAADPAQSGPHYRFMQMHPDWMKDNFGLTQSVTLQRIYDTRDNVFAPTEGRRVGLSAEFAGRFIGGDFDYNKYTFDGSQYLKVGSQQVVALRLQAGYGSGQLPDASKFAIGGIDSLRGYDDLEFKGSKMVTATAEYRFPIVKKVQGVVFTDVGNAWDDNASNNQMHLKLGVGVGVNVNTPLGPIRLDYARGDQGGKIEFGFGGQF